MMMRDLVAMGAWGWVVFGLLLLVFEMIVPGTVILWIGIAGIATGLIFVVVPAVWQVQALTFAAFSAVAFMLWRRYAKDKASDSPLLNRAQDGFVGRVFPLDQAIENGFGRIRLGDTTWTVAGPELPAGAMVRVVAAEGAVLRVEAE